MRHTVVAGLPIVLIGIAVASISATYPIGSLAQMGPGFLPLSCGILLVVLGAAIAVLDKQPINTITSASLIRPTVAVFAGLGAWTLAVQPLGLVPATFLLVVLVSFAQPRPHLLASVLTAAILSVMGVLVFILGLNIRLTAFWF